MSLAIKPTAKANLSWWGWFAIALAFGPFIAKRAILLDHPPYIIWLVIDYSARVISLVGVVIAGQAGLPGYGRPI